MSKVLQIKHHYSFTLGLVLGEIRCVFAKQKTTSKCCCFNKDFIYLTKDLGLKKGNSVRF